MSSLVWFRQDLRTEDNPALTAALALGKPVLPIFIWAPEEEGAWAPGGASRWWLHQSLTHLQKELKALGLSLTIRQGNSLKILHSLAKEVKAEALFWNRRYEPASLKRDGAVKAELQQAGLKVQSFNAHLLFEPWTISNKQGKPYQVFTPFWKQCLSEKEVEVPLPFPSAGRGLQVFSLPLDELKLLPHIPWDEGIRQQWKPGAAEAKVRLDTFIKKGISSYSEARDRPDLPGVSHLSPYLHFGELSPRMIWQVVQSNCKQNLQQVEPFLRQLGWREFAYHLLYHFPKTPEKPLHSEFETFPWHKNEAALKAWQKGETGYPLVDAGMRELWTTGWMHNRVRMVVGSFLVKDLLLPWLEGARWFWDTLVDADLANNTLGWQWVAGCGADAAPYYRIFNPTTQGEKFDPDGTYVRKWVPELSSLPSQWIHCPSAAPPLILQSSGLQLGKSYPYPIVDHAAARETALKALTSIRKSGD